MSDDKVDKDDAPGIYVVLRAYKSSPSSPDEVTARLQIEPTLQRHPGSTDNLLGLALEKSVWSFSSERFVHSDLCDDHVDYLMDRLLPVEHAVKELQAEGWEFDVMAPWIRTGFNGPSLAPKSSASLAELGLRIWFPAHGVADAHSRD